MAEKPSPLSATFNLKTEYIFDKYLDERVSFIQMVQSYVLDIFYIKSMSAAFLLINPANLKVIKQDVRRTYR